MEGLIDWRVREKRNLNYFFFIFLFFTIFLLSLLQVGFSFPLLFFFCAALQALVEVGGLLIIFLLLGPFFRPPFLLLSLCLLLLHFTQFTLQRLMDASLSYPLDFFFGGGLDHFLAAVQALNFNRQMIISIILSVLLFPLAGLLFYSLTDRLSQKHPYRLSPLQVAFFLFGLSALLVSVDVAPKASIAPPLHHHFAKALPWGRTLSTFPSPVLALTSSLVAPEEKQPSELASWGLQKKPNIYFFVIETLRTDFLTQEIAPHLTSFGKEHYFHPQFFANASATHLSWFAIFHAQLPFHWTYVRDHWKEGSLPLQLLKKAGYRIHVFSSANLRYYGMDRVLFGKNKQLAHTLREYSAIPLEPWERDALALRDFEQTLDTPDAQEGNVFLFFFDSTHSEYSFPNKEPPRFQPIVNQIDYLTLTRKEIEPIKNRYRNAIYYVDSLMGDFFHLLKDRGLYEDAILMITGDHGEEFFEEGALFHGTHLNQVQTHIPLWCKFSSQRPSLAQEPASHIDLFPTLFHVLTEKSDKTGLFDGESLFSPSRRPFRIAVLQNGTHTPCQFALYTPEGPFVMRFPDGASLYTQKQLELLFGSEEVLQKLLLQNESFL